jgi:antiviral helicase SLH1
MQSMNRPTFLAILNHSPEKPVIVFVPSRRQTRLTAKDLINLCGMEDNPRRFLSMDEDDLQLNLSLVKDEALKEAISFGIGLHHAGLVESDRQLSEELFLNNKIQILIATSTLAWGVNLPAHLVVVKGTQYYDAKIEAYKDMDLTDVLQMLGRAGRPQFDNSGVARILTQDSKKDFYKHFLHTGFPVESSLHTVLDNHLCAEICAETIITKQDALDYLTWTFFFRRLHKNPSYYGLEISAEEHNSTAAQQMANEFMISMVDASLSELIGSKCVEVYPNGDIDPTPLGKIMSYYYLSHKTIRQLVRKAKPQASFLNALSWMCLATEYDELPVRHNEDLINAELSRNLTFPGDAFGLPMWDPHVKAFLLLQAHMSRITLPITDYVGDQTSVLDQAIRIIQASIDVMAELGYLSSMLEFIHLLQSIKSARWPDENPASILPGVNSSPTPSQQQKEQQKEQQKTLLQEIAKTPTPQLPALARTLGIPQSQLPRFTKAAACLPNLAVSVDDPTTSSLTVTLRRLNPVAEREARIYAPRFPKPQTEGWFVVVADVARDEVLAVKRVGWRPGNSAGNSGNGNRGGRRGRGGGGGGGGDNGGRRAVVEVGERPVARAVIKVPPVVSEEGRKVDVLVLSDGYVGMEWRVQGVVLPAAPRVEAGVVEKKEGGGGWEGGGDGA